MRQARAGKCEFGAFPGAMPFRAIFCLSSSEPRQVLLDRRFPTVERRVQLARQRQGLPPLVLPEEEFLGGSSFRVPQVTSPLGRVALPSGEELAPLVHIERDNVLYVALPQLEGTAGIPPVDFAAIATALDFLEDLARMVEFTRSKRGAGFYWEEIDMLLGSALPFGTILESDANRLWELQKTGFPPRMSATPPQVSTRLLNGPNEVN